MITLIVVAVPLLGQTPKPGVFVPTPLVPAELAWQIMLERPPAAGGAIDGDRIYVPLQMERFAAFSRRDGQLVWVRDIESATPPLVNDGVVYVTASDELFALDDETGGERWRIAFEDHSAVPVALAGDLLIGAVARSTIVAIATGDGSERWRRILDAPLAQPVAGDARLAYAALEDGTVVALSLADGAVQWTRKLEGRPAPPTLVGNRLVIGTDANEVFALDSARGTIEWRWRVGADVVGAAGNGQTVFVAALDNMLRAVNRANGNQRWKKPVSSRPAHPPQIVGNVVVLTSASPTISVYSTLTGMLVGTYVAPAELAGAALPFPPSETPGITMAVITRDGRLIGLRLKAPVPPAAPAAPATPAPPTPPTPPTPPVEGRSGGAPTDESVRPVPPSPP